MMPESRNSPLLVNGSLTLVSMEMLIRGDRLVMERAFLVNKVKNIFHGYAQATNIFRSYHYTVKAGMQRRLIRKGVQ
jgi:hypothetical protein